MESKEYTCSCCGHKKMIATNHFGTCWNYCENCSWKGLHYDKTSKSVQFSTIHRLFEIVPAGVEIDYTTRHYS